MNRFIQLPRRVLALLLVLSLGTSIGLAPESARADRVKDLVTVGGVRPNQLVGYGLVVGLQGTGDGQDISFTGARWW
jgi:flagellar P-ring protein precursor FlgI